MRRVVHQLGLSASDFYSLSSTTDGISEVEGEGTEVSVEVQVECSQVHSPAHEGEEEELAPERVRDRASYAECRILCHTVAGPEFNPWGAPFGKTKEAWSRVLCELNSKGLFLGRKEQFIQHRVTELLRLHTGEGNVKVSHGLTQKSVSLNTFLVSHSC